MNARHLGGQPALRDAGQVASAVMRPSTVVFGTELFPTAYDKAATLLHSLICSHPFLDANKRTAWAATRAFMLVNRTPCSLGHDEAFALVMGISNDCSSVDVKDLALELGR